jgi:hypothetical protein
MVSRPSLRVEGVYRRLVKIHWRGGRSTSDSWHFFAQLESFEGTYVAPIPISRQTYDAMVASGATKLIDRGPR